MQTFATTAPITAVLDIPAGRIELLATDQATTTVEVLPANPDRTRDLKAAQRTTVDYTDGVLRITGPDTNHNLGSTGALQVTVNLPAGSHLQATTAAAELRTTGPLGDVAFEGAYREISIGQAAGLQLTAVDGDVEVGRLTGSAQIRTARGDIRITEAGSGTLTLETQSGSVTVGVAPGVSASLDAATPHGRISNSLKNDGTTGLAIHATTSNGDITAHTL
ncbi:DUF4097 family beta strand repeat-containing protein [Streptacidiphilus carbonis]|uniref:DUF4097 family beta strand repeat-containing protein n=1 Tax=Streptacidiphilus carbonis TaxID=105422 RepID=UPI0005A75AEA|nr:DUF4097 family beta strand repeat-containing protein [Streptacidiphilus carbonis]